MQEWYFELIDRILNEKEYHEDECIDAIRELHEKYCFERNLRILHEATLGSIQLKLNENITETMKLK